MLYGKVWINAQQLHTSAFTTPSHAGNSVNFVNSVNRNPSMDVKLGWLRVHVGVANAQHARIHMNPCAMEETRDRKQAMIAHSPPTTNNIQDPLAKTSKPHSTTTLGNTHLAPLLAGDQRPNTTITSNQTM